MKTLGFFAGYYDLTTRTRQSLRLEHVTQFYPFDGETSEEDALDQDTVPFEAVEADLALAEYRDDLALEAAWCDAYDHLVTDAPVGKLREGVAAYHAATYDWEND